MRQRKPLVLQGGGDGGCGGEPRRSWVVGEQEAEGARASLGDASGRRGELFGRRAAVWLPWPFIAPKVGPGSIRRGPSAPS
jgi:hypothetical protein